MKKWCLLLSKRLGIILLFLIITTVFCGCTYAGGVPKYNPKDPNPKPGLYYVGETKYFPGPSIILKDGRVLIMESDIASCHGCKYSYLEIFDPSTGKFTTINQFPYYLNLHMWVNRPHPSILLDDGRVLFNAGVIPQKDYPAVKSAELYQIYDPENNSFTIVGRSSMCRSYLRHGDQIYPYYTNIIPYKMTNLKDGKIASYCYNISNDEMEIIDVKNTTISKPIKKGDKGYIPPPAKYPKGPGIYRDLKASYRKLYPELNLDENLNLPNNSFVNLYEHKLTNTRYLVYATNEVDYGVTKTLYGKVRESWLRPLYEYNTDTKELIKKNEYLRGAALIYHLNDTNKLVIIGGEVRNTFPPINPNANPKDISLIKRVLYPYWTKKETKKVYIYVY